ncbi:integrase core domain-containing protein [Bifidobacterium pseudolongum]|uniref:integrase core domain-containing protein n=1 Tax=Bifidobacterium pseudolongum TaxID=1694 RepID=UPI0010214386
MRNDTHTSSKTLPPLTLTNLQTPTQIQTTRHHRPHPTINPPHTYPTKTPDTTLQLIIAAHHTLKKQGHYAGARSIRQHLQQAGHQPPHESTIQRKLKQAGLTKQEPKKRPRTSWNRFEADLPNELWQSDFTHLRLADNTDVEVIGWLDDHSRFLLHLSARKRVLGATVTDTFWESCTKHDPPAATLTDNGVVYTTRFGGGGRSIPNAYETLGIEQCNSRPGHPTTQGKIERLWQTLKRWITAQPKATGIAELNEQLARFMRIYNEERPHSALNGKTPHYIYTTQPKLGSVALSESAIRFRTDKVDQEGKITIRYMNKIRHLGIGRGYEGKRVYALISGKEVTVILIGSGEIIGEYILDPNKNYHARKQQ